MGPATGWTLSVIASTSINALNFCTMPESVFLDEKEIVLNETLIIPDGSVAKVVRNLDSGDVLKMNLTFVAGTPGESPKTSWVLEGDALLVKFEGWTTPTPSAFRKPIPIGRTDTREEIYILAAATRVGETTIVIFQVLIGKTATP
jgi:hypothetical protein